jgi:itaconyl-CoA hydratase
MGRPDVGIGRVETTGFNQDATPVVTFVRKMMVYKKDRSPKQPVSPPES